MAPAVLLLWPLIAVVIFQYIGPIRGLIWVTISGYLLLPQKYEIDLPALPPYDKTAAISVALILGLIVTRERLAAEQPPSVTGDHLFRVLMGLCVVGLIFVPFMTMITNPETLVNGPHIRPALGFSDARGMVIENIVRFVPFVLAWRYLAYPKHIRELVVALLVLGIGYSFLALFEARMSPQLNRWVYGYFQHSWAQHFRGGDFRPIVFLEHGLSMGFLLLSVAISGFALSRRSTKGRNTAKSVRLGRTGVVVPQAPESDADQDADAQRYFSDWEITKYVIPMSNDRFQRTLRKTPSLPRGEKVGGSLWFTRDQIAELEQHFASEGLATPGMQTDSSPKDRRRFLLLGIWGLCVLLLSKNLGASMLAILFGGMLFLVPRRLQVFGVVGVAIIVLGYPAFKHYSTTPVNYILEVAARVSEDRANSLLFRLKHEEAFLNRAFEKPLFGWGGYARAQIYNDKGENLSVNDGTWIITYGEVGWFGYLSFFGLLAMPLIFLFRARYRKEIPPAVIGIAIISAANLVYLIPNSTLTPLGLLMFGTLAAFTQRDTATYEAKAATKLADASRPPHVPYTRYPDGPVADHHLERGRTARKVEPGMSLYRRAKDYKDA